MLPLSLPRKKQHILLSQTFKHYLKKKTKKITNLLFCFQNFCFQISWYYFASVIIVKTKTKKIEDCI